MDGISYRKNTPFVPTSFLKIKLGSREKAYLHAITSAGIMYSVTKACASGNLVECGCDHQLSDTRGKFIFFSRDVFSR